jgi:Flp pilus assembly protein TadD
MALLVAAAGLLAGCAPRATPEQIAAARQNRSQSLIESGNEAYRIGDYRLAARRYAAAAVVKKNDPAAYFGMGMALSKLGRDEEARTAYARARELSRTNAVLVGPHGAHGAPAETIPARTP